MTDSAVRPKFPAPEQILFIYELMERKYLRLVGQIDKGMTSRLRSGAPLSPDEHFLLSEVVSTHAFYVALSWSLGLPVKKQSILENHDVVELLVSLVAESPAEDVEAAHLKAGGSVHSPIILNF